MSSKHKRSSRLPYIVAPAALALYNLALVAYAFRQHDGLNLLLYSLVPDMFSVYLALHGFHQSSYHEQHAERHLRKIAADISDVKMYVATIAGVSQEVDF